MNDEKLVGGDAYIPSDTENFDRISDRHLGNPNPVARYRESILAETSDLVSRISTYVQFNMDPANQNEEAVEKGVGILTLSVEAYVNLHMLIARMETFIEVLAKRYNIRIGDAEMMRLVNDKLAAKIKEWEDALGIDITKTGTTIRREETNPDR
jgi:hypothetical protein